MKNILQLTPSEIKHNLRQGKFTVAIIGLGHVGLPISVSFAKANAHVIGADINSKTVEMVNMGKCPIVSEPYLPAIIERYVRKGQLVAVNDATLATRRSHAIIISVPTLLNKEKKPDLSAILLASKQVSRGLNKGSIVIVVSSLYPGATENIVLPTLEAESNLKAGVDFGLAYSPERIDPGNVVHQFDNTPRILGAIDRKSIRVASGLLGAVMKAKIIEVSDIKTAEAIKIIENIYRDVNIALVNELALLCEKLGIDINEVISAAATKWSFQPHRPGAGVGGMCIPVAPYYLMKRAEDVNCNLNLIKTAREINEAMPNHMIKLTLDAFKVAEKQIDKSRIAVLGICYKGNVKDTRMTPAIPIIKRLGEMGAKVVVYDPLFSKGDKIDFGVPLVDTLDEALHKADCMLVVTDHDVFKKIELDKAKGLMNKNPIIIDGRHVINPNEANTNVIYRGIGSKLNNIQRCKK